MATRDVASGEETDEDRFYEAVSDVIENLKANKLGDIVEKCDELIQKHPDRAEGYGLMAVFAHVVDDPGRAIQLLERAHKIDPNTADYANGLATLYTKVGRLSDGLYYGKLATTLNPHPRFPQLLPDIMVNYAQALVTAKKPEHFMGAVKAYTDGDFSKTITLCERHLQIEKNDAVAYTLLAKALLNVGESERALSALHAAAHLTVPDGEILANMAMALTQMGRFEEALACAQSVLDNSDAEGAGHGLAMQVLSYQPDAVWPAYRTYAAKWAKRKINAGKKAKVQKVLDQAKAVPSDKLRIGYLSRRFHEGEVSPFLMAMLKKHDKKRFEVVCYSTNVREDTDTVRFQNMADIWVKLKDVDSLTAAMIIKNDGIDVLVDLDGKLSPEHEDILAMRPAARQVSWLAYPEAAALSAIDVVFADPMTHEADRKMCLKGQELYLLKAGLFAQMPFVRIPEPAPLPMLAEGAPVFGGVADLSRLSMKTVELWSRVLDKVPESILVLSAPRNLDSHAKQMITERFAHFGKAGRVTYHESELPSDGLMNERHLEFCSMIDVMLDTTPVSAGLQIPGFLWMGVPVITLTGKRRVSNLSASILRSALRTSWVAQDEMDFPDIAADLVADPEVLAKTRREIRDELPKTPLFMPNALMATVEAAYIELVKGKGE